MECRVCGDGTQCGLGTATGWATAEGDSVRAAAVFSKPLLGFLPFGRCCVIPFLGCDFQGMSALAFRQPTDLRVDLGTEKRDPVFPGQAATTLGDRKSVVEGTSVTVGVDLGGRRSIKKKKNDKQ